MENGTEPHSGGHQDTARAYLALISDSPSFPAMHISDEHRVQSEASSHSGNISETMAFDDVHEQAYQEVLRGRDLLPILEERAIRSEGLIAQNRDLADKFGRYNIFAEKSIKLLSFSRDDINRLDEERCHKLLRSVQKLVPFLRSQIPPPRGEAQPWASRIHLQPKGESAHELSHSTNPSKVLLSNWYDHLHIEVKYMHYMYAQILISEHKRLKWLISEGQVPANKVGSFVAFLEKALNLMSLARADIARAHKKECRMLAKMTKLFLTCKLTKGYANKGGEYQWPLPNLYAISEVLQQMLMKYSPDQDGPTLGFEAVSNYSRCPHPDGCLSEGDWYDQAHKELLSMRMLYSSELDEACINVYMERLCKVLSVEAKQLLYESLEFLATSRAEMGSLSKEKCYNRMMLIKFFAALSSTSVSANQKSLPAYASINSTCPIQLGISRNWRDLVFDELLAIRKKFSSVFDESYRVKLGLSIQNLELASKLESYNEIFFKDSLDLLGYSRADIAFDSMENCLDGLMKIREFLKCNEMDAKLRELSSEVQNWRDEAYEEMRSKLPKYDEVRSACGKVHEKTYQIPSLAKQVKELGNSLGQASEYFDKSRSHFALLSKEEYYTTVESVNADLAIVEERLTSLQLSLGKRVAFPYNFGKVRLKQRSHT